MAYENVFDFLVFNSRFDDLESVSGSAENFTAAVSRTISLLA
jgi:hypothetical protein